MALQESDFLKVEEENRYCSEGQETKWKEEEKTGLSNVQFKHQDTGKEVQIIPPRVLERSPRKRNSKQKIITSGKKWEKRDAEYQ